jgi:hypothetical protein
MLTIAAIVYILFGFLLGTKERPRTECGAGFGDFPCLMIVQLTMYYNI